MKISKEEVSYVAHLARLEFNEEETEKFTSQLNDILMYMEKLNLADTAGVEPISHATVLNNAFRDDVVQESLSEELALANAPDSRGGCFRVPKIVE